jgi:hypothetical protein
LSEQAASRVAAAALRKSRRIRTLQMKVSGNVLNLPLDLCYISR